MTISIITQHYCIANKRELISEIREGEQALQCQYNMGGVVVKTEKKLTILTF